MSVILFRFDLIGSFFNFKLLLNVFFVGKISTHNNITLAVRSEYHSGIKGRKNPKYCPGFRMPWNQFKDQRTFGSINEHFFREEKKKKKWFCQSEIPMMMVAISNMSGVKWVNYNLMDVTFYSHWQYRFICLCQKTHPFVLSERFIAAKQHLRSSQFCSSRRRVFSVTNRKAIDLPLHMGF